MALQHDAVKSRVVILPFERIGKPAASGAAEPGNVDFSRDVRPILGRHCFKCHGPDDAGRQASRCGSTGDAGDRRGRVGSDCDRAGQTGRKRVDPPRFERLRPTSDAAAGSQESSSCTAAEPRNAVAMDCRGSRVQEASPLGLYLRALCKPPLCRPWPAPIGLATRSIYFVLAHRLEREGLSPALRADRSTRSCGVSISIWLVCLPRRKKSTGLSTTRRLMPMNNSSIGCWPRLTTASDGRAAGSDSGSLCRYQWL